MRVYSGTTATVAARKLVSGVKTATGPAVRSRCGALLRRRDSCGARRTWPTPASVPSQCHQARFIIHSGHVLWTGISLYDGCTLQPQASCASSCHPNPAAGTAPYSCTAMWKRVGNAPPNTLGADKWPDAHGKALATGRTRVMVCMHRIVSKEVGVEHGLLRREDCELFSQGGTCRCHALGTCAVHYL
jgi:hypothetical protein